jgi:hypothetical protein
MSTELDATFDVPIDPDTAEQAEVLFEKHAGVYVESLSELEREIVGDLDPRQFGIGWWAPALGDKRRIFLSDYLVQCVRSVGTNMVEAALHLLEANAAHSRASASMAHAVVVQQIAPGTFRAVGLDVPQMASLRDLLPRKLADLHVAGFLRSIGSALDTLAALTIGVGAFRLGIVRADFDQLRRHLGKQIPPSPGSYLQQTIQDAISTSITDAGPDGWLEWATQYRNTLVHRGRRIQFCHVTPDEGPILYSANEAPMPRARLVLHLARDPGHSDLQALFGDGVQPTRLTNVLEEDAFRTLRETIRAVTTLVEDTTGVLVRVWRERRSTPSLLPQPIEQWPGVAFRQDRFSGFAPGTAPLAPDTAFGSPTNVSRLEAAAVSTAHRHLWQAFTT